jgi:hypothetical protein
VAIFHQLNRFHHRFINNSTTTSAVQPYPISTCNRTSLVVLSDCREHILNSDGRQRTAVRSVHSLRQQCCSCGPRKLSNCSASSGKLTSLLCTPQDAVGDSLDGRRWITRYSPREEKDRGETEGRSHGYRVDIRVDTIRIAWACCRCCRRGISYYRPVDTTPCLENRGRLTSVNLGE